MNPRVEEVGVNKATPNAGWTPVAMDGYGGEDEHGDHVARHKVTTTSSSSVRKGTIHVQRTRWQGRIVVESWTCWHCPFLMTRISKGCQRNKMKGTIRDRDKSITDLIWLDDGKISKRYPSITPANGVWNTQYHGITLLGQKWRQTPKSGLINQKYRGSIVASLDK